MPDRSYIASLERLGERFSDEDLRDIVAACQSLPRRLGRAHPKPRSGTASAQATPETAQLDDPKVLGDIRALQRAVTTASVPSLLLAIVKARETDNTAALETIRRECCRRPEEDMIATAAIWSLDQDPRKRTAAALALSREATEDVTPPHEMVDLLLRLIADVDPQVVVAALGAIGERTLRHFDDSVRIHLEHCETDPSDEVRIAYARMYQSPTMYDEQRSDADVDVWVRLTRDPSPTVRTIACGHLDSCAYQEWSLAHIDREDVREALFERLEDEDMATRCLAMSALGRLGESGIIPFVERELAQLEQMHAADVGRGPRSGPRLPQRGGHRLAEPARYVPALRMWLARMKDEEHGTEWIDGLIEDCKRAA